MTVRLSETLMCIAIGSAWGLIIGFFIHGLSIEIWQNAAIGGMILGGIAWIMGGMESSGDW